MHSEGVTPNFLAANKYISGLLLLFFTSSVTVMASNRSRALLLSNVAVNKGTELLVASAIFIPDFFSFCKYLLHFFELHSNLELNSDFVFLGKYKFL